MTLRIAKRRVPSEHRRAGGRCSLPEFRAQPAHRRGQNLPAGHAMLIHWCDNLADAHAYLLDEAVEADAISPSDCDQCSSASLRSMLCWRHSGGWLHKCKTPWGMRRSLCSEWATAPQRRHQSGSETQWLTEEAINDYLSS